MNALELITATSEPAAQDLSALDKLFGHPARQQGGSETRRYTMRVTENLSVGADWNPETEWARVTLVVRGHEIPRWFHVEDTKEILDTVRKTITAAKSGNPEALITALRIETETYRELIRANVGHRVTATSEPSAVYDDGETNVSIEVFGWQRSYDVTREHLAIAKKFLAAYIPKLPRGTSVRNADDEPVRYNGDPRVFQTTDEDDWDIVVHLRVPRDAEHWAREALRLIRAAGGPPANVLRAYGTQEEVWDVFH